MQVSRRKDVPASTRIRISTILHIMVITLNHSLTCKTKLELAEDRKTRGRWELPLGTWTFSQGDPL